MTISSSSDRPSRRCHYARECVYGTNAPEFTYAHKYAQARTQAHKHTHMHSMRAHSHTHTYTHVRELSVAIPAFAYNFDRETLRFAPFRRPDDVVKLRFYV